MFALLDLGDFSSNKKVVDEFETRFIWKTMEKMGYVASTPGVRELNLWPFYHEISEQSPIRVVSSNLTVVENGQKRPVGIESFVTEINGVDVGFFAVMGENELQTVKEIEGISFEHEDPLAAAERIVPELRKQAEMVVLMSQLNPQETRTLVQKVPGIDVALVGRRPAWIDRAVMESTTIVQETGIRGQFHGEMVVIVDPDGRVVDWGSRNITLAQAMPEDAEIAAEVSQVQAETKELIKASQKQRTSDLEHKLSSERYLGADRCGRCHEAEHQQWAQSAHAKAFDTLMTDQKHENKECIGCHVTGWEIPSGFTDLASTANLKNVQCESCHNVGTMHARGADVVKVTEETCVKCHTGDWGKDFDFKRDLKKVAHSIG